MQNQHTQQTQLINISLPLATNFDTAARIVAILPDHPYPLVVANNHKRPQELYCYDVFGNASSKHTTVLRNVTQEEWDRIKTENEERK